MTIQSVTLNIPQTVYEQIQRAAEKKDRSVDDILLEALTAVAPVLETTPTDLQSALAQMAYLNDAALLQAARASMTEDQIKGYVWKRSMITTAGRSYPCRAG